MSVLNTPTINFHDSPCTANRDISSKEAETDMDWRKLMVVLHNFANTPQTCFFSKIAHLTENTKLDNSICHGSQGINHSLSLSTRLYRYRYKDSVPASDQMSQKEWHDFVLNERTQICIPSSDILNKFTKFKPDFFKDVYNYSVYLKPIHKTGCEQGSWVAIATDYGLDGPGSNPGGDEIFCQYRPALGHTHPSVQWGTGSSPEVKCGRSVTLTTHPILVPQSWNSRAIPLPNLWARSSL